LEVEQLLTVAKKWLKFDIAWSFVTCTQLQLTAVSVWKLVKCGTCQTLRRIIEVLAYIAKKKM